jgi:hypothetical protein
LTQDKLTQSGAGLHTTHLPTFAVHDHLAAGEGKICYVFKNVRSKQGACEVLDHLKVLTTQAAGGHNLSAQTVTGENQPACMLAQMI